MDTFPPDLQRHALATFALALWSANTTVRRDECGDPRILGSYGHIYAVPGGWQLIVEASTVRAWSAVKRRLAFARLIRDGDTEGAFHLDRLPNAEQATTIRLALGIRKRPSLAAVMALLDEEVVDLATLVTIPQGQVAVVQVN